jgi:hypothetical protein
MMRLMILHHALWISFALLTLASPGAAFADIKPPFVAPDQLALVVFIQNLREDRAMTYTVFDLNKQCVAEVGGRQVELVPMKPGKHSLYITAYDNHRIDMSLAAGRTYFVRLYSTAKVTTRASNVTVVQRGGDAYKQLGTWLHGADVVHVSDDPCSGKPLKERANRTQRRINDANGGWNESDPATKADYMLIQSDGLTQREAGQL